VKWYEDATGGHTAALSHWQRQASGPTAAELAGGSGTVGSGHVSHGLAIDGSMSDAASGGGSGDEAAAGAAGEASSDAATSDAESGGPGLHGGSGTALGTPALNGAAAHGHAGDSAIAAAAPLAAADAGDTDAIAGDPSAAAEAQTGDTVGQPGEAPLDGGAADRAADGDEAAAALSPRLRPRKRPKTGAEAAARAAEAAGNRERNAARPLALLLEGAEGADPRTLDALVAVLSEVSCFTADKHQFRQNISPDGKTGPYSGGSNEPTRSGTGVGACPHNCAALAVTPAKLALFGTVWHMKVRRCALYPPRVHLCNVSKLCPYDIQVHERLPVTLVLCVRAAPTLLLARLARPAVCALRCSCFPLPLPAARLETALVDGMLGAGFSGVFPGPALLSWLGRRFWQQDASVAGFIRGLQVGGTGFCPA